MTSLSINNTSYQYYGDQQQFNQTFYIDAPLEEIFPNHIRHQIAMLGTFLAIVTFIINCVIISCCLKVRYVRQDAFYLQIINFGITNLCVSIIVLPFTVYYILYPWSLGQTLCKTWIVIDIMIPFTSITILLIMTIDRIILMSHPNAYKHLFQNNTTKIGLVPWIVAFVIVVPIWTLGNAPYESLPGECIVVIKPANALLCHILTYFIPLVILLSLTLKMVILMLKTRSMPSDMQLSSDELRINNNSLDEAEGVKTDQIRMPEGRHNKVHISSIVSVCAVSFLFVAMWSPFQFISIMLTICNSHTCVPSLLINQAVTWMGTASATVTPLLWIIDRNMRMRSENSCCSCREGSQVSMRQNSLNSEETFV